MDTFKAIVLSVREFIEEGNLMFSADGMYMHQMSSAHTVMIDLNMPKASFLKYKCTEHTPIGVKFESLKKIVKATSKYSFATIIYSEKTPDYVEFEFETVDGKDSACYKLYLMDINVENVVIPQIDYKAVVKIPYSYFSCKLSESLVLGGEDVNICIKEGSLSISSKTDLGESVSTSKQHGKKRVIGDKKKKDVVDIDCEDESDEEEEGEDHDNNVEKKAQPTKKQKVEGKGGVKITATQEINCIYFGKYFKKICTSGVLADDKTLTISLHMTYPAKIGIRFGSGELNYYIAPKTVDE